MLLRLFTALSCLTTWQGMYYTSDEASGAIKMLAKAQTRSFGMQQWPSSHSNSLMLAQKKNEKVFSHKKAAGQVQNLKSVFGKKTEIGKIASGQDNEKEESATNIPMSQREDEESQLKEI